MTTAAAATESPAAAPIAPPVAPVDAKVAEPVKVDAKADVPADVKAKELESMRFARNAKEEQKRVEAMEKIKADRAALDSRAASVKALEDAQALVKAGKRLDALKLLGVSYDDLTAEVLAKPADAETVKKTDLDALEKKLADAREKERAEEADTRTKAAKEADQRAMAKHVADADAFLADDAKAAEPVYQLTAIHGNGKMVSDLIVESYNRSCVFEDGKLVKPGKILSFKEAADLIEKDLEEQTERSIATPKFKAKLSPKPEAAKAPTSSEPKTLSNAIGATTAAAQATGGRTEMSISEAERFYRERAKASAKVSS